MVLDVRDALRTWMTELPVRTVSKGLAIVRRGAVEIESNAPGEICAIVDGTERYDVSLFWDGEQVETSCDCRAFENYGPCKHVFAVAVSADAAGYLGEGRSPLLPQILGGRSVLARQDPREDAANRRADQERELWRATLRTVDSAGARAASKSRTAAESTRPLEPLDYEIGKSYASDSAFQVTPRAGASNGYWRPLDSRRALANGLESRLDRRILTRLALWTDEQSWSQRSNTRVSIPWAHGAKLLRLLAGTGRAHLTEYRGQSAPRLRLDNDGAWSLSVRMITDETEHVTRVIGALVRGDEVLSLGAIEMVVASSVVIHGDAVRTLTCADPYELGWLEGLAGCEDGLVVPDRDLDEFITGVVTGPYIPPGVADELGIRSDILPRPLLSLRAPSPRAHPRGALSFDYDGARVESEAVCGVAADEESGSLIARQRDAEDALRARLLQTAGVVRMPHEENVLVRVPPKRLLDVVTELLAADWSIEVEGRIVRAASGSTASVSSGQDWFDVEGGVDFDGTVAPLPDVLAARKAKSRFVRLADGTDGLLPEGFEDTWGILAHLGRRNGDGLRFALSQGLLLDALLASREGVRVDAQFAELRERAARFDGIRPRTEPSGFRGTLRQYQREALGWFAFLREFGLGGCLADDMGLGKTVQVLALLAEQRAARGETKPSLVVAPRSVIQNWADEAGRFTPGLRVLVYGGNERAEQRSEIPACDLIVTTYGILRRDAAELAEIEFDYAILDEAQMVKNPATTGFKAARLLRAAHRLALTGTPVENRLSDLWAILDFLCPGLLGSVRAFRRLARATTVTAQEREQLAKGLRPVLLRRTKSEVAKDLPERTEQVLTCDMTRDQRTLYDQLRNHYRGVLLSKDDESAGSARDGKQTFAVLEALLRLRQAACDGQLIGAGKKSDVSGKLDVLSPLLDELLQDDHKVLVFSQFTSFLSLLRDRLDRAKTPYLYLDGKTRKRQALVERFQSDPDVKLFLISLKAGGLGLNLTAADYVFLLDPWWNPAVEAQAIDRTHRIGQTRKVVAYRLISRDTVEDKVLALQHEKRELADAILSPNGSLLADLTRDDLERLLG